MSFVRVIRLIRLRGTCIGGGCLSLKPWATLDAFDSVDSDPGPHLLNLMHQKWLPGLAVQAPSGPSGASASNAYTEANDSKVGPKARTLDSLDSFDSDPGPHLMDLMNRKSPPPRPGLFRLIRCIRIRPWSESNGSDESKVGPQGQDFIAIGGIRLGPWSESNAFN